ncbi:MAG: SBBP repeat-containing protein [Saprospiraceae bacterium]
MSIRIYIVCICSWLFLFSSLQAQTFLWAGNMVAENYSRGNKIAVDGSNNIYIVGTFDDITDMDPGPGEYFLSSNGQGDAFVSKLDDKGNLIWAKRFGGTATAEANDIVTDVEGNIYVIGSMSITGIDTIDFDPGPDVFDLITSGGSDIYVLKLDRNGNFIWAGLFGGPNLDFGYGITLDLEGNIYATGSFAGEGDFDPGPGVFMLSSPNLRLDAFVFKLNNNGSLIWAKGFGGEDQDGGYDIAVHDQHVYSTGFFFETADFDPGSGTSLMTDFGTDSRDIYISILDQDGNFIRALQLGGTGFDNAVKLIVEPSGNIITCGIFGGVADFDPGPGKFELTDEGSKDNYIAKYDSNGNLLWAKKLGGQYTERITDIEFDHAGNLYGTGYYAGDMDFDPGSGVYMLDSYGPSDAFFFKWSNDGDFKWAIHAGNIEPIKGNSIAIDTADNVVAIGVFAPEFGINIDFDPSDEDYVLYSYKTDMFVVKYVQSGVIGNIFQDKNGDCHWSSLDGPLSERNVLIQPGNLITQSSVAGKYYFSNVPVGDYTVSLDTSGHWSASCENPTHFSVLDAEEITKLPSLGLRNTETCYAPEITLYVDRTRRCFSNPFYITIWNLQTATATSPESYVILTLDSLFILTDAEVPFTSLGNHQYRLEIEPILPNHHIDIKAQGYLSCDAITRQTICMKAELFPASPCVFSLNGAPVSSGSTCPLENDLSDLGINGWCENDTIFFRILNNAPEGSGDMYCFSPVSLFIDGIFILKDSVQLHGGESQTFSYVGDGRTWRMEVEQHPHHIGNSHPNATIEHCGNIENWHGGLVTILPEDDLDPVVDYYCQEITGSFDPNDKTGFPKGVDSLHFINPNGKLDYVIRFQNTGNDTAFTIVIRDTLDTDLDLLSVRPGVSSHPYSFRMYGKGILEWTFNHIALADSIVDEEGSHGFVTFGVNQIKDLADGTEILNTAAIYFDFNDPVVTNGTSHMVSRQIKTQEVRQYREIDIQSCDEVVIHEFTYSRSGTYFQLLKSISAQDTLLTIHFSRLTESDWTKVRQENGILISEASSGSYQWIDCAHATIIEGETTSAFQPDLSGTYAVIVSQNGCVDTSECTFVNLVDTHEPQNSEQIHVYPNPTTNNIIVDFNKKVSHGEIVLTDLLGRTIEHVEFSNELIITININDGPGVYVLRIAFDRISQVVKVLRN